MSPTNKIVVSRSRGQLPPEIKQDWETFTHAEESRQAQRERVPVRTAVYSVSSWQRASTSMYGKALLGGNRSKVRHRPKIESAA